MRITGIAQIDELVNPVKRDWVVELYGDENIVLKTMHYTIAYRSIYEYVYVVLNIEFGGIDTLYLVKLCRLLNCRLDNIYVSRSFSLDSTLTILKELLKVNNSAIVLVYPYNYLPSNPLKYSEATRITGLINKIALTNQVVLFNTITKYGYFKPEGGSLHHHLVKVIVKLNRKGNLIVAELIKHPVKARNRRVFTDKILKYSVYKPSTKTIIEWLVQNKK